MGRRTVRLRHPNLSAAALQVYQGQDVSVMLDSGQTVHGTLVALTPETLVVLDHNQVRPARAFHRQTVAIKHVREICLSPAAQY